jgi:hypothetical protein
MTWFKAFAIFGAVSEWLAKATQDGVIDQDEIMELVTKMLDIAGVKAEFKIPNG